MSDADVVVIGAGGGGAVIAKELGELGIKVVVLEAGPWYGNRQWPKPNRDRGATHSSNVNDLDVTLYKKTLNLLENNVNDFVSGVFRWGPADRRRAPWYRSLPQQGLVWQDSGVGGSTMHYFGNSPRAFPKAIDGVWPISYKELIPYYEKVEDTLPVNFAVRTAKEDLFYYGAKAAGWTLNQTLDVTRPGYRPSPNAILPPNENLQNPQYSLEELDKMEGCTLRGHCANGCSSGPSVEKIAKRSTLVSYVPLALKTGNVNIMPNVFTTKILTEKHPAEGLRAIGVQYRDTWTGEAGEVMARVVVMAAGSIESPRLWLNSGLPHNAWVGRGLTNHFNDWVSGVFDEKDLRAIVGLGEVDPFVGHTSGARLDYPGLGILQPTGLSPGLWTFLGAGFSQAGYSFLRESDPSTAIGPGLGSTHPRATWDAEGSVVGRELKEQMLNYRRTLGIYVIVDDETDYQNGITVDSSLVDEHGPVPVIRYAPSKKTIHRRDQLCKLAADILRKAGAKKVVRTNWPPMLLHIESTMRMGFVTDTSCEAHQVKRLYIADNSVHYNGLGGSNPTLTTQALATRTAEKVAQKYFS